MTGLVAGLGPWGSALGATGLHVPLPSPGVALTGLSRGQLAGSGKGRRWWGGPPRGGRGLGGMQADYPEDL